MKTITLRANAKINLALAILGKREDGYHLIDTVMQSVSLYDTLRLTKADKITVESGIDIPMEKNIAFKAAQLFFDKSGENGGVHIEIVKRIPEAAGLGGGSADAAAVLVGLNLLYGTNINEQTLCDWAIELGADVPFFIKGGTQRSEGIGEILSPCKPLLNCCFVIVKKGSKPSTREMYNKLDNSGYDNPDIERVINAIETSDIKSLCDNLGNCFWAVSGDRETEEIIKSTKPLSFCLSGSGPSIFAVYENRQEATKAAQVIKEHCEQTFVVEPQDRAIIIE